jgi:hypothetical protein
MFKWNRGPAVDPTDEPGESLPDPDELLVQGIARHFEGATVEGNVARIGLGGVEIHCSVYNIRQTGSFFAASMYFRLYGGPLGPAPIFASVSGYEESPVAAVVGGACNWACSFGPVLRSGLTGVSEPEADEFEIVLDGRRFRGVSGGLDRVMMLGDGTPEGMTQVTRAQLGADPWLAPQILSAPTFPLLASSTPTVLSVFLSHGPQSKTVEVKVNGADWGPATVTTEDAGPEKAIVMLRELTVLTAIEPAPPLRREAVQRTLDGFTNRTGPGQVAGWPGWRKHGGRLGEVLADVEVSVIEVEAGPLPSDYRHFLTQVAGPGAGPGYGLSYPRRTDDCLVLAQAGCGVAWVLRLDQAEYGTVWADAAGSDETYTKVASSFTEWFTGWLDASVRDVQPWVSWDYLECATAGLLVHALEQRKGQDDENSLAGVFAPGAIALTGGGGHLPAGSALDPCHGCVELASRFDLPPEVFAPGILSS